MASVNCSSEEGEASEYPSSSQRSTLDSNPGSKQNTASALDSKMAARSRGAIHKMAAMSLDDDGTRTDSDQEHTVTEV